MKTKILLLLLAALATPTVDAASHRDAKLYALVEASRETALDMLKDIVNIDSGTGDVEGGRKVEQLLSMRLTSLGAEVRISPAEADGLPENLLARWHGTGKGRILLIAHIDTVFGPGTAASRPFRTDAGRAYGPGVGDEKGGVVNAIMAMTLLTQLHFSNFKTITLLLDDSEERGSPGSTRLIRSLSREHDVVLNMEPGDPPDDVTVWRKGSATIRIDVTGRSAHAGMAPQNGRNAATELLHQLTSLEGKFPHSGDQITVNLTVLRAGERTNIIPDSAEGVLNVRYRQQDQFQEVLAAVESQAQDRQVPDTKVSVSHDPAFPPLTENPQIDALAARAKSIYAELGRSLGTSGNGGASESALAMAEGTPALDGLGFVGGDFHTDHEWIELSSVTPRLYLLTRLLMQLGPTGR